MLTINLKSQHEDFVLNVKHRLPSNQIIGLFGASGSGKSRLIRQILGFDQADQKHCAISFNKNIWSNISHEPKDKSNFHLPTEKRGIGYLPQTVDLFPHLNVMNNILFGYNLKISDKIFDQPFIEQVIEQLDLSKHTKKMPHQLSGGQQQRVALARGILASSGLIILDEPLSSIGEDHKPKAMQLLKQVNQQFKLPIIFSSHNRYEHAFLTDYLLTFENGEIKQAGEYKKIATDIDGKFSQQSDAINHITAKAVEFEKEFCVNRLKTEQHVIWAGNQALEKNSLVNLEIKAQDVSLFLNKKKDSSILNSLNVRIIDFKNTPDHQVIIKLAFEDIFITALITKKSFSQLNLKKGQELYAKFKSVSVLPFSMIS
jgi:molybdate transport system ATP-binding protein